MLHEPGVRFAVSNAVFVGCLFGCRGAGLRPAFTEAIVYVAVAACALALPPAYAAGIGGSAWALFTGFVENEYGVLTFAQADLVRFALLVATGVAVAMLTNRPPAYRSHE